MAFMKFAKTAMKNLFSKPATEGYPFKEREYPERSRGHIEIDIDKCIMCSMCQRKCPSGAITVDRGAQQWSIDRMACVQCANCVNSCPKSCLSIVPGYTPPAAEKVRDIFKKPVPPAKTAEQGSPSAKAAANSAAAPSADSKIANDFEKCILCTLCARKCPQGAITVDRESKTWSIDREKCIQCGVCIDACLKFHALSFSDSADVPDTYKK
ncbi:MAG: 4Fe-4S dicluster domain-containing protein [Clostridiales bacterium]|nr:4Fe-4S dicluster domain-containing protein [Clostridiales bacterium]